MISLGKSYRTAVSKLTKADFRPHGQIDPDPEAMIAGIDVVGNSMDAPAPSGAGQSSLATNLSRSQPTTKRGFSK